MITRWQIDMMSDDQKLEAMHRAVRTAYRLVAAARGETCPGGRRRHLRHALLFVADANRISRRVRRPIKVDEGARSAWVRSDAHYRADRAAEGASLWVERARRKVAA